MEDVIILKLEVDSDNAQKNIDNYNAQIEAAVKANADLRKSLELTDEQLAAEGKTRAQLTQQIEVNSEAVKAAKAARQTEIKVLGAQMNSIEGLKKAIAAENRERERLNLATAEGAARYKELTASIAANQIKLNDFNKEIGRNQGEVGNYKEAIKQAAGELNLFGKANQATGGALGAAKSGIDIFKRALGGVKGALIATGIGAFVVIIGTLIEAFRQTNAGMKMFEQISASVGTFVAVLRDKLAAFGKVIMDFGGLLTKVLTGQWSEVGAAADKLKASYNEAADGMKGAFGQAVDAAKEAKRLTDEAQQLEIRTRQLGIENKMREAEMAKLRTDALDKANFSEKQRAQFLKDAENLLNINIELEKQLAQAKYDNIKAMNALSDSSEADLDKEAAAYNKLAELDKQLYDRKRELLEKQNSFADMARAKKLAMEAEIKKSETERQQMEAEGLDADAEAYAEQLAFLEEFNNKALEPVIERLEREKELQADADMEANLAIVKRYDFDVKMAEKAAAEKLAIQKKYAQQVAGLAAQIGDLFGQTLTDTTDTLNDFYRKSVLATVQMVKNAVNAKLIELLLEQVAAGATLNFAKLATTTAGIFAVNALGSVAESKLQTPKLARGGMFSGKSHAGGGIQLSADGRPIAEVEGGEAFFVLNKKASREIDVLSNLNQKYGGIALNNLVSHAANGGQINTAGSGIDTAQLAGQIANALQAAPIFVKVTDINSAQSTRQNSIRAGVV